MYVEFIYLFVYNDLVHLSIVVTWRPRILAVRGNQTSPISITLSFGSYVITYLADKRMLNLVFSVHLTQTPSRIPLRCFLVSSTCFCFCWCFIVLQYPRPLLPTRRNFEEQSAVRIKLSDDVVLSSQTCCFCLVANYIVWEKKYET